MINLAIRNNTDYRFRFKKDFISVFNSFCDILKYDKNNVYVDVLITNNNEIKRISNEYRNINKETDVLSFPFEFNKFAKEMGFLHLGEIVLSYEKIKEQAKEFNHSIKREFCYLFAHGLVHLSGRDHKKSKEEENKFNNLVYKIMDDVKIMR